MGGRSFFPSPGDPWDAAQAKAGGSGLATLPSLPGPHTTLLKLKFAQGS